MALNLSTLTSSATSGDVLAEALTTADFLENVPVLRNLARGSQKGGDAKQGTALNQPKALPLIDGDGYLYCSGVANNYAAIADEAALDVSGDLTLEADLTLADWTPSSIQRVVTKYNTGGTNNRSYQLYIDVDGNLGFVISSDGSYQSGNHEESTVSLPSQGIVDGQRLTIRAEWRASDGRLQFFYKTNGGNFTQLGTDQSAPAGSIHNSSEPVIIGASNGGASSMVTGAIHGAKIYASINDTNKVLDVDFTATNVRHGDTKFKCATGQVVTINQSGNDPATIIKKPVLRFDGTNDGLQGLFNQTITEGAYMFAAFSVLGDGGEQYTRVFQTLNAGNNTPILFSSRNQSENNIYWYSSNNTWQKAHDGMYDDERGDILHELSFTDGLQKSRVNNADAYSATLSESNTEMFSYGIANNHSSGSLSAAIDLEYLALFPATITDAQADSVRNFINNRNNVFSLVDGFGYYFFDPQSITDSDLSGATNRLTGSWEGRIVGSDNGDTSRSAYNGTEDDQPTSDKYTLTFADNTDNLSFSISQAGWQVVGTSLGTFAYRVNANAVSELNLLGNLGNASYRQTGDLYGIILLPESATGKDIEDARKLLIDRGAADGVAPSDCSNFWRGRADIINFENISFNSVTNITSAWRGNSAMTKFTVSFPSVTQASNAFLNCTSLSDFRTTDLKNCANFANAWQGCSSLSSFPSGAKLGTEATNVNFTSAWQDSGLTSFPDDIDLSKGGQFLDAWHGTNLTSFSTPITGVNAKRMRRAWRSCTALTDFSYNVFANWNPVLISSAVFDGSWSNCTSLTAQSVENILTSIDASGKYATSNGASGGSALGNAGIDISYNTATGSLSAATNAAVTSLKSKGWSIIVNNVTL
jgi:hypothetical protein